MNRSRHHVSDYDGDLVAPQFHVGICSCDINSIRQGCHIIRVWGLSHDVQSMIHHHSSLGTAVHND